MSNLTCDVCDIPIDASMYGGGMLVWSSHGGIGHDPAIAHKGYCIDVYEHRKCPEPHVLMSAEIEDAADAIGRWAWSASEAIERVSARLGGGR